MKIRKDFVTNSSSSCFVIQKNVISEKTARLLTDLDALDDYAKKQDLCDYDYPSSWSIYDRGTSIVGYTTIDNFDMEALFVSLGIAEDEYDIRRGGGWDGLAELEEIDEDLYRGLTRKR